MSKQGPEKYVTPSRNQTSARVSILDIFLMRWQQRSDMKLVCIGSVSSPIIDRQQSRNCQRDFHFMRPYHSMIFI